MPVNPAAASAASTAVSSTTATAATPTANQVAVPGPQTGGGIEQLERMLEQVVRMLEELKNGRIPDSRYDAAPTVTEGQQVGSLNATLRTLGEPGKAINVEDVIGASSNEREAFEMARRHSAANGGEPVAIVVTHEPVALADYAQGEAQRAAEGAGASAAADAVAGHLLMRPATRPVYNVVTLDPAVSPERAGSIASGNDMLGATRSNGSDPRITWIIDDHESARAGMRRGGRPPIWPTPTPPISPGWPRPDGPPYDKYPLPAYPGMDGGELRPLGEGMSGDAQYAAIEDALVGISGAISTLAAERNAEAASPTPAEGGDSAAGDDGADPTPTGDPEDVEL